MSLTPQELQGDPAAVGPPLPDEQEERVRDVVNRHRTEPMTAADRQPTPDPSPPPAERAGPT